MKEKIINHLIREVSIDPRIKSGVFDPYKQEDMDVLREYMVGLNFDYEVIREFTNKVVEGKYPERQAYNKEGFLVTFPTPDYKAKALSSGNYFNEDPTHGRGGMHLVRKAEPERLDIKPDIQQPETASQPSNKNPNPVQDTEPKKIVQKSPVQEPSKSPKQEPQKIESPVSQPAKPASIDIEPKKIEDPVDASVKPAYQPPKNVPAKKAPEQAPVQPVTNSDKTPVEYLTGEPEGEELDLTDFSAYKDPSLEWAHNQKWEKRDNGNYYDDKGNLRAVIGLDGSAVPATEKDRVSLRTWIDKKRKERLPGEKY